METRDVATVKIIFEKYEYGVTDSWAWIAYLEKKADGTLRLTLEQQVLDSSEEDSPEENLLTYSLDPISNGDELFDFINNSLRIAYAGFLKESEWKDIAIKIQELDPQLSDQVLNAVQDNYTGSAPPDDPIYGTGVEFFRKIDPI